MIFIEADKNNMSDFNYILNNYSLFEHLWSKSTFIENTIDILQSDNFKIFLLKNSEEVIGYSVLKRNYFDDIFEEYDLLNFVINKKSRNCGIGKIFFEKLIDFLNSYKKDKGIKSIKVFLEVDVNNLSAIKIYEKYGKKISVRKNYYYYENLKKHVDADIFLIEI